VWYNTYRTNEKAACASGSLQAVGGYMNQQVTVDVLIDLAGQLSTLDKVRLIEWLAPQIAQDLQTEAAKPRKSLRGLWRGQTIESAEIDQARKEIWQNFPREDI
jgi:hypothetical protein